MSATVRLALAVTLVWLRPLHAVRRQQQSDRAFRYMCDVLVMQDRQNEELRARLDSAK